MSKLYDKLYDKVCDDVWLMINWMLPLDDLIKLSYTCKRMRIIFLRLKKKNTYLTKSIQRFIETNLKLDFKEFAEKLIESNGYLTGSSFLTATLGLDKVKCSDIDIFVEVIGYGTKESMEPLTPIDILLKKYKTKDKTVSYDEVAQQYEFRIHEIKRIRMYYVNGMTVQVIHVENPMNHILDFFDFNVLMNWFNGKWSVINHLSSIVTKEIKPVNRSSCELHCQYRIEKYKQKGFHFTYENISKYISDSQSLPNSIENKFYYELLMKLNPSWVDVRKNKRKFNETKEKINI